MSESAREQKVLFVCQHGGAKSVLAAAFFNRLTAEKGLPYVGEAVASEEPYPEVVASVASLLDDEGLDVAAFRPRRVDVRDFAGVSKVVSIGCSLPAYAPAGVDEERWDDVPAASEDLAGSVQALRRHVEALAGALRGR